jgi:hypothetical protein
MISIRAATSTPPLGDPLLIEPELNEDVLSSHLRLTV